MVWNIPIFLLATNAISTLATLPVQVILTYLVPANVEASTMALISGIFVWSYEVGAKASCYIYCLIFSVDDEHMNNYPNMLAAKLPMIVFTMILTIILPNNNKVKELADKLRKEHQKKL